MRAALLRTAVANVASRRLQSALIALIVVAAAAALTVALNVRAGAGKPYERNFRATDGAHVYVRSASAAADLRRIERLPGVRRSSGPYPVVLASTAVAGRDRTLDLVGVPAGPLPFDRPRVVRGRWVRPGERAVVVENSFARAFGVRVGQRLRFARPGLTPVVLTVAGVAVSTTQRPAPTWSPSAAWTAQDVLRAQAPRRVLGELLAIQLDDRDDSGAFVDRARRTLPAASATFTDWREVRASVTERTTNARAMMQASSLFALIAVGLIVANTIAGRVLAQRRELGILKAVGMTPREVTGLLLLEHVGLAGVAAVAGTAIGAAVSPLLMQPTARLLGTPTPSPLQPVSLLAGTLGIVAVVAAFTALPGWRAGRLGVVEAIGGARGLRATGRSRLARAAAFLRLPPPVTLGVKDAFARRGRAALTIASLALTVGVIAAALSTEATFKRVIDDSTLRAKPYDIIVSRAGASPAQAQRDIAALGDRVRAIYTLTGVEAVVAGDPTAEAMLTRALGGDYRRFPYAVRDGRNIAGPGEAIVGRRVLEQYRLHVGDRLPLRVRGHTMNLEIVGRYVEPDNDSRMAVYDAASLPGDVARRAAPNIRYGLDIAPGADPHAVAAALGRRSRGALDAEVTRDEVVQERNDLRPVVYGTNLLLLVIGFVNLLTTLLLGVRERERDFGVFKVLGLTPRQLLATVTSSGLLLAVVAIAAGTPLGIAIFRALIVSVNPADGPDIVSTPPWWWIALLVPGALLLCGLASVLPARRAAEVRPGEVLRYE